MAPKQWLVDIPPEIRNQVYRALFRGIYVAMTPHKHDHVGRTSASILAAAAHKSLSLTSKAVRNEASAFYFSEAEFVIEKLADCNQAPTLALDKRTIHLTCHTESLWEVGEIARYLNRHVFKAGRELESLTLYGNEVIRWLHDFDVNTLAKLTFTMHLGSTTHYTEAFTTRIKAYLVTVYSGKLVELRDENDEDLEAAKQSLTKILKLSDETVFRFIQTPRSRKVTVYEGYAPLCEEIVALEDFCN